MHTVYTCLQYVMCTYVCMHVCVHVAQPLKVLHAVCVTYVCSMNIHTYMYTLYREMLRVHLCVCVCVCVCVCFWGGPCVCVLFL